MSWIQLPQTRLWVQDQGRGPGVLLVHGFPLDHSMWKYQQEFFLARGYRVVAPDLRGLGQSPPLDEVTTMAQFADDLAQLLQALEVSPGVIYVGLSMGGYVAWEMVRRHRRWLRAMVLCDTKAAADTPEAAQARLQLAQNILQHGMDELDRTMREKLWAGESSTRQEEDVEHIHQVIRSTSPQGAAAALRGMAQRQDATELLPQLELPVLYVCGDQDVLSTPEQMHQMAQATPGARWALIPQAGHMAPIENPQAVNRALEEFLDNLS